MGVSTSVYISDSLAKKVYSKEQINSLENEAAVTFPNLPKADKSPDGQGYFGGKIASGNQLGQRSINQSEALPTADYQQAIEYRIRPKVFVHKFQVTGLSLETLQGNEESYADNLTLQMDQGIKDSTKELNQQVFRDGSGVIARTNGAVSASSVVIIDGGSIVHFRLDEAIDVFNSTGTVKDATAVRILDIDIPNLTLTLTSNVTLEDNGYIYRTGVNDNAPTDGKELDGFPRITDDGTDFATYENVARTGTSLVSKWKGIEIAAGGVNLSDDLLQRTRFRIQLENGMLPDRMVSNNTQARKYLSLTLPQVQFNSKGLRDTGGSKTPGVAQYVWEGITWDIDTDALLDEVYLYVSGHIKRYDTKELHFSAMDGNILKQLDGFDVLYGYAKYYGNIGTDNPKAIARITGLATPSL